MARIKNVALTFAMNFAIAFGIASYLRDRKTGVKAGLALGLVAAVAALVLGGGDDEVPEFDEADEVGVDAETTAAAE